MVEIINGLKEDIRIWIALIIIIFITISEASGQFLIKTARNSPDEKEIRMFLGIICYIVVCLLLYRVYKYEGLGHVNLLWSCMSIIVAYASGCILFAEPFNIYTVLAIVFACVAMYFSYLSDSM